MKNKMLFLRFLRFLLFILFIYRMTAIGSPLLVSPAALIVALAAVVTV